MLFIKDTPVDQILSMREMIKAIEDALKELRLGRGFDLPRRRIHHPNRMIFGLLPGSLHGLMGAYLQTDLDRRLHNETVILYSVETGRPFDPVSELFDQRSAYRSGGRDRRQVFGTERVTDRGSSGKPGACGDAA
jgi:hypothetical protein